MKILREIYLRSESHLPEHGWLQACWTCDTITSRTLDYNKITKRRYIDWVITTPTMLISTIIFMKYVEYKEQNKPIFGFKEVLLE